MRKAIVFALSAMALLAACEGEKNTLETYDFGSGYIQYEATIGYDYASALDSLLSLSPPIYNVPYYVDPVPIAVPANRSFYMISFKDSINGMLLGTPKDAIDTKGGWYRIFWRQD